MSVAFFLDSSALVKLVIAQPESEAHQRFLRSRRIRVTSSLAKVEVRRGAPDLDCVVTYDRRMSDAARVLGMVVRAPGAVGDVPRRRAKKLSAKRRA